MTTTDEIERIEQVRADLVQQRERHLQRLEDRLKGKPLPKGMAHLLSKQVYTFTRQIRMHDREIQRLRAEEGPR